MQKAKMFQRVIIAAKMVTKKSGRASQHKVNGGNMARSLEEKLEELREKYGIKNTWLAEQLGMTRQAFNWAVKERGLSPTEVAALERALRKHAAEIGKFKF